MKDAENEYALVLYNTDVIFSVNLCAVLIIQHIF